MTEPRRIAIVSDYDGLIDALRKRIGELGLTNQTIDEITGLQPGYSGKLLGDAQIKKLGPLSFGTMLQALGLALVVVEDHAALARVAGRHEKRERPPVLLTNVRRRRATWLYNSRAGRRNGRKSWTNRTERQRQKHIQRMNKARWKKWREKRKARRKAARRREGDSAGD